MGKWSPVVVLDLRLLCDSFIFLLSSNSIVYFQVLAASTGLDAMQSIQLFFSSLWGTEAANWAKYAAQN